MIKIWAGKWVILGLLQYKSMRSYNAVSILCALPPQKENIRGLPNGGGIIPKKKSAFLGHVTYDHKYTQSLPCVIINCLIIPFRSDLSAIVRVRVGSNTRI